MKPMNLLALPNSYGACVVRRVGVMLRLFCIVSIIVFSPVISYADDASLSDQQTVQNSQQNTADEKLRQLQASLSELGWGESDDETRKQTYAELTELVNALDGNTEELRKNYEDMKAKEQSTANKLIGAIGIGTVGAGGMQLASGLAEKSADESAEQDMRAYLATFRCTYADGKMVRGGETDVVLPAANIAELKTEYMSLAADLRARKEALNMSPGIEAEEILDSAVVGLYDDESLGRGDGAYTSLSRALLDESSEDAAEWSAQKEDAEKSVKVGAGLAIGGAVASAAASLIANKDAPKERSAEILAKRDETERKIAEKLKSEIDNCNNIIKQAKTLAAQFKTAADASDPVIAEFISDIEGTPELAADADIKALMEHPVCR